MGVWTIVKAKVTKDLNWSSGRKDRKGPLGMKRDRAFREVNRN